MEREFGRVRVDHPVGLVKRHATQYDDYVGDKKEQTLLEWQVLGREQVQRGLFVYVPHVVSERNLVDPAQVQGGYEDRDGRRHELLHKVIADTEPQEHDDRARPPQDAPQVECVPAGDGQPVPQDSGQRQRRYGHPPDQPVALLTVVEVETSWGPPGARQRPQRRHYGLHDEERVLLDGHVPDHGHNLLGLVQPRSVEYYVVVPRRRVNKRHGADKHDLKQFLTADERPHDQR